MKFFASILFILFLLENNTVSGQQAGSLDKSFNKTGIQTIGATGGGLPDGCNGVAILPTGKIILVGAADTLMNGVNGQVFGNAWAIFRLNKNGTIDSTFGYHGHRFTSIVQYDDVANAIVIKNGNFYVAGLTTGPMMGILDDMAVVTYKTTGMVPPFGPPEVFAVFDRGDDTAYAITIQKNSAVVGAGVVQTNGSTKNDFGVFRISKGGFGLDGSFNGTGTVTTDFSGTNDGVYSLDMQGNNILAAGYTTDGSGKRIPAFARYTSTGKLDSTFGTNGKVVVNTELLGPIHSIKALASGKIIATCTMHSGTSNNFALIQLKHNGALDNTFGSGGIGHSNFTGVSHSLAVESPTGKLIVCGTNGSNFEIARFNSNGTVDSTFGTNGEAINTSLSATANSIAIDPDGKYVIAGGQANFEIARYLPGLTLLKQDFEEKGNSMLIYPNPVKNVAKLNYTLPKSETVSISLFDITGKLMKQFVANENKPKGMNAQDLNLESFPAGEYFLVVQTPNQKISIQIIKQ